MTFDGFPPPTKNFFSLPNEMINIIAHITNMAELKIIIYVIRHTWGFHEYGIKKAITTDEFMHGRKRSDGSRMDEGTGLSNRSVIDGLRAAVKHGYLEDELDDTDKARKIKSYALKMKPDQIDMKNVHIDTDEPDMKNVHIGYEEPSYQGEESSHQGEESSYRTEKDTIEKHLKKKTKESVCDPAESIPAQDTHTSFENSSSSEHIAEPTTQQTHSAGAAMSATAPRTSNSPPPSDVRGVPLQDHNRVGSPPADDKSQTNKPVLSKQELALRRKWAKYVTEDVSRETVITALELRSRWIETYGPYGDAEWDNQAILWLAQQDNGTWENIQKVVERWAKVKPGEPIHPEMVKNKWFWLSEKKSATPDKPAPTTTSSISHVSQEVSDRNLARLHARIAAKHAAAGKEG